MEQEFNRHRQQNVLQSLLLLGGLWLLLFVLVDRWFASRAAALVVVGVGVALSFSGLRWSGPLLVRRLGAVSLDAGGPTQNGVVAAVGELARRAGLNHRPRVFLVASPVPNAFATTWPRGSAITLTEGLLRRLNGAELVGVLAHEVAHVRHRDLHVLALADLAVRMTSGLATFGWLLALIQVPLLLFGVLLIHPLELLLLLLAPRLAELLRLALSRTREFDADLEAARLSGRPEALASALRRLEGPHRSLWMRLLLPGTDAVPGYLRTHPSTESRIRRLQTLARRRPDGAIRERWELGRPGQSAAPRFDGRGPRTVWQILLPDR